jgi:hypothetical protein
MASPAQILANQANARLSTGPRTPEGKAASSRNRVSHGLFCTIGALSPTDRKIFEELRESATAEFLPACEEHHALVAEYALAKFRIDRVRALERAFFALEIDQLRKERGLPAPLTREQLTFLEAEVMIADLRGKSVLNQLLRWERAFIRDRNHAGFTLLEAAVEARQRAAIEMEIARKQAAAAPPHTQNESSNPIPPAAIPRSAPCPCGSGEKYKRCCGKDAPPQYHARPQAAAAGAAQALSPMLD